MSYGLYSFGTPFLMTIVVYILHTLDTTDEFEMLIGHVVNLDWRPGFGEERTCWFTTCSNGILFLYGQVFQNITNKGSFFWDPSQNMNLNCSPPKKNMLLIGWLSWRHSYVIAFVSNSPGVERWAIWSTNQKLGFWRIAAWTHVLIPDLRKNCL